jgi:hypothetical protein
MCLKSTIQNPPVYSKSNIKAPATYNNPPTCTLFITLKMEAVSYFEILVNISMLSGSTVTTAWRVLGLWIEETASRYGG